MRTFLKISWLLMFPVYLIAGNRDSVSRADSFRVSGYIKGLTSFSFDKGFSNQQENMLIHNRLNFRWKPFKGIVAAAEFRNRVFAGDAVKSNPQFADGLRNPGEQWNLQKIWLDANPIVVHSNTERLFFDMDCGALNLRIGRQRINWGITTTWNPNDIFNAWNFLDFDYEERVGVDAFNLHYQVSDLSEISAVYAITAGKPDIGAVRYFFNRKRFDVQMTAGKYQRHYTAGLGWAGHIGEAGFKGELQYFLKSSSGSSHLNFTAEADHLLGRGWYLSAGFLFNSSGIDKPVADLRDIDLNLSAENLMPGRWSVLVNGRKEINPLLSGSMGMVYSPGLNLMIFLNTISYNLRPSLDVDLVMQAFYAEIGSVFQPTGHLIFLRVRWSF